MRLAVFADIHGNLTALEAMLTDAGNEAVSDYICLGDVANTGPCPSEALELVRALDCPVIMGNTDASLLEIKGSKYPNSNYDRFVHDIESWCKDQLVDEHRGFIQSFHSTIKLELNNKILLAYHGSLKSYFDYIDPLTADEKLYDYLFDEADIYMGAHTHEQFIRRFARSRIMNPGSVGIAYFKERKSTTFINHPIAEYAILDYSQNEISVSFKRVVYELKDLIQTVEKSTMPHKKKWSASFLT